MSEAVLVGGAAGVVEEPEQEEQGDDGPDEVETDHCGAPVGVLLGAAGSTEESIRAGRKPARKHRRACVNAT
jgi:hypothetical protein